MDYGGLVFSLMPWPWGQVVHYVLGVMKMFVMPCKEEGKATILQL